MSRCVLNDDQLEIYGADPVYCAACDQAISLEERALLGWYRPGRDSFMAGARGRDPRPVCPRRSAPPVSRSMQGPRLATDGFVIPAGARLGASAGANAPPRIHRVSRVSLRDESRRA